MLDATLPTHTCTQAIMETTHKEALETTLQQLSFSLPVRSKHPQNICKDGLFKVEIVYLLYIPIENYNRHCLHF